MKKVFTYGLIVLLLFVCGITLYVIGQKIFIPKKVHYHAGVVVFQNNKKVDLSQNKYMFFEPCTLNKKDDDSPADIQIEKAHLHDNVGDVVHIEREGATWKDFFTNIKFPIDYTQTIGYINGQQVANFASQPIHSDDSVVVFIGTNDKKLLSQAVTKKEIEKKAKKSTTCGD